MKKLLALILIITICLVSCSKNTENQNNYLTNVDCKTLADIVLNNTQDISFTQAEEAYVELNISVDTSLCDDYTVYISQTGSADLFGIFKANSLENADKVLEMAEEYLENLEKNFMSEYQPDELPKVKNAVAKQFGTYVIFTVLEEDQKNLSLQEIETTLKG